MKCKTGRYEERKMLLRFYHRLEREVCGICERNAEGTNAHAKECAAYIRYLRDTLFGGVK